MPSFSIMRRVPFTPQQMFDLVADVEAYPQFVPLCQGLRVKSRTRSGEAEVIVADMDVGYKAIRETFTSRVTLERGNAFVRAEGLGGPFQHLENRWRFVAVDGGCNVEFHIAYELKSLALRLLVGSVFDRAFRRFAEAFEARAHVIYADGTRAGAVTDA